MPSQPEGGKSRSLMALDGGDVIVVKDRVAFSGVLSSGPSDSYSVVCAGGIIVVPFFGHEVNAINYDPRGKNPLPCIQLKPGLTTG